MNQPSSTITTATIAGALAGVAFIFLALVFPNAYVKLQFYPGAEAHLTTLIMFLFGYFKKENVLQLK